jgi:hypothetical protein
MVKYVKYDKVSIAGTICEFHTIYLQKRNATIYVTPNVFVVIYFCNSSLKNPFSPKNKITIHNGKFYS